MEYPWILPTPSTPSEPIMMDMSFPATMVAYQANLEWEELHHRSYFLPELDSLEHEDFRVVISERVGSPMVPLRIH